jgi:hypothetical protein
MAREQYAPDTSGVVHFVSSKQIGRIKHNKQGPRSMTRNLVRGTIILCVFGANGFAAWQQPVFRGASTKTSPEIFPQRVTRIGKTGQAENPTRGPCHIAKPDVRALNRTCAHFTAPSPRPTPSALECDPQAA